MSLLLQCPHVIDAIVRVIMIPGMGISVLQLI